MRFARMSSMYLSPKWLKQVSTTPAKNFRCSAALLSILRNPTFHFRLAGLPFHAGLPTCPAAAEVYEIAVAIKVENPA